MGCAQDDTVKQSDENSASASQRHLKSRAERPSTNMVQALLGGVRDRAWKRLHSANATCAANKGQDG